MAASKNNKLILASASSRRLNLLEQVKILPDEVYAPQIDESPKKNEAAPNLVRRLALAKADAASLIHQDCYIIAADTVVTCGRRILPKVLDEGEAITCLNRLSGRRHRVYSGICVISPNLNSAQTRVVNTSVKFKHLSLEEIKTYIKSKEWYGKAGGYAIQGFAGKFVVNINGSYTNVVGLPLYEITQMLMGLGYKAWNIDGSVRY